MNQSTLPTQLTQLTPRWWRLFALVALILLMWLSHACITSPADLQCRPCLSDGGSCGLSTFTCINGICQPLNATEPITCEAAVKD